MPTPNTADLPISEEKERKLVTEHLITGWERQGSGKRHVWSRARGVGKGSSRSPLMSDNWVGENSQPQETQLKTCRQEIKMVMPVQGLHATRKLVSKRKT